jgi:hypothetical protein
MGWVVGWVTSSLGECDDDGAGLANFKFFVATALARGGRHAGRRVGA